jgi:hypothetical protein
MPCCGQAGSHSRTRAPKGNSDSPTLTGSLAEPQPREWKKRPSEPQITARTIRCPVSTLWVGKLRPWMWHSN